MKSKVSSLLFSAALGMVALIGSGCSTIVHGGGRSITINSQPAGATVVITKTNTKVAVHSGITPMTVLLSPKGGYFKGQPYTLEFKLDGYQPATVQLTPSLSGWYFGNIVFGGLIGMVIVDPLTGAMWNLSPDKIEQPLTQASAQLIKDRSGFVVVMLSTTTESERRNMVRIN